MDAILYSRATGRRFATVKVMSCLPTCTKSHGNTPVLNPDGSVPILDREPERLVCVFYYQEKMEQCERTIEKEHQFINRRERGGAMRKAKAKAAGKK